MRLVLPTYLRIFVPVEAFVSEGALSLAQVEVSALFLLEFHPVVAQQPLLLLFGVDPVLGRADVVRRHPALGTSSETKKLGYIPDPKPVYFKVCPNYLTILCSNCLAFLHFLRHSRQ